ncbi:MAG: 3'-5' exonuclease domain-containing protein 2 [Muribaculaceae bacterium]|nr:3'-5' exonuclease domain-containing protein 2 [Muribaculaceae bacterium]
MDWSKFSISIKKEQVAVLPTVVYPGYITVIEDEDTAEGAIAYLNRQSIIGVDTETKPMFRKGRPNKVSLVQIATATQCFLFRINKLGFFDELRQLFENKDIIKVGLSLKDDFHALHRVADFTPKNIVELQTLVKDYKIRDCSLQKIYAIAFGERISKGQRLSNWEADVLSPSQQSYAAIDAWACLKLYDYFKSGQFVPENSQYIVENEEQQEQTNQI